MIYNTHCTTQNAIKMTEFEPNCTTTVVVLMVLILDALRILPCLPRIGHRCQRVDHYFRRERRLGDAAVEGVKQVQ